MDASNKPGNQLQSPNAVILIRSFLTLLLLFSCAVLLSDNISDSEYRIETLGDRASGTINKKLDEPIGVLIKDADGQPVPNVEVIFYSANSGFSFRENSVFTDSRGKAVTKAYFGSSMGDYDVEMRIYLPHTVEFEHITLVAFDYRRLIFLLIGGLGLFLFGIRKVSESLRIAAGDNLKRILAKLTTNRWLGVGVGISVTALLQSSSAVTVMAIGFVNAGLLTLKQSISVLIGANVGTTITAQIIAFRIGEIALPAIAVGTAIILFSKSYKTRAYASIILGFGMLFFGLDLMTEAVIPIRSSSMIYDFFAAHSHNYLLAILAGTVMTMLVQSSSATVGITIVLAVSGLIDIYAAMALVLGDNIGTTITGALASIGGSVNAKRTALSNVFIKVVGAAYMLIALLVFPRYMANGLAAISSDIARQVANFHTLFNVVNTLVFIPLIPLLAKVVTFMIPEESQEKKKVATYLSSQLLSEPSIAIDQIKLELNNMIRNVRSVFDKSIKSLDSINMIHIMDTFELEAENDRYQLEITDFIAKLSRQELSIDDSNRLPVLLHLTNDLEKAADFSRNIAELAERKLDKGIEFNNQQKQMLSEMSAILSEMLQLLPQALENNDQEKAKYIAKLEEKMNECEIKYKKTQVKEISAGKPIEPAIMIMDIITNIEKAGDHLYNLAQAIMGALSDDEKALYSDLIVGNHS